MESVPSAGLVIWRNIAAIGPATVLRDDKATRAVVASADPDVIQRFAPTTVGILSPTEAGWTGAASAGGVAVVASAFDGAWQLTGTDTTPQRSFGWSTSFPGAPADTTVRFADQFPRTISIVLLAAVWAVALWVTRKPVGG
jgi:hypothetical protein